MESKNFSGVMKQRTYEGIIPHLERAMSTSVSAYRRNKITKNYMIMKKCEACRGYKSMSKLEKSRLETITSENSLF